MPLACHMGTGSQNVHPGPLSTLAQIRNVTVEDLCLDALWDSWQGLDQEVFQDLFVQEAILMTSAQAGGRTRLISETEPSGRAGEGSWQ